MENVSCSFPDELKQYSKTPQPDSEQPAPLGLAAQAMPRLASSRPDGAIPGTVPGCKAKDPAANANVNSISSKENI